MRRLNHEVFVLATVVTGSDAGSVAGTVMAGVASAGEAGSSLGFFLKKLNIDDSKWIVVSQVRTG